MSIPNVPVPDEKPIGDMGKEIVIRANYELFVLALTILQVVNSILILLIQYEPAEQIPAIINNGMALFLTADAVSRLWRAPDRRRFFFHFHGYLTFLGSLPIPFSGLFRLAWYRVITMRLRRADYRQMEHVVFRKRAQSAMLVVFLVAIIVLEVGSIFVIRMESSSANANIVTADDAIWWSLVTMATVGYGDYFPVTVGGRFVALFVMIVGVAVFSVLTSYLSQAFLRPRGVADVLVPLGKESTGQTSQSNIAALRELLDQQEETHKVAMAEIRAKLDALEGDLQDTVEKTEYHQQRKSDRG